MASSNYFSITPGGAQFSALSAFAGIPAQATIVQPAQAGFITAAVPRTATTFEAYPTSQAAAQQFAFAARSQAGIADYFTTPVMQAAQTYDPTKAYYTPVAAVAPAPTGAAIYTLPVDAAAVYQAAAAAKYPQLYDAATKKYFPIGTPVAAPSAVPTTMYTVAAEPIYQTLSVGGKPVYVANTYPTVTPGRHMATAIKLIQTGPLSAGSPVSVASYSYQPLHTQSIRFSSPSIVSAVGSAASNSTARLLGSFATIPGIETSCSMTSSHIHPRSSAATTLISSVQMPSASQTFVSSAAWHSRRSTLWRGPPVKATVASVASPQTPQQMYYCRLCQIGCVGAQTYKEHLEGQRHKKKEMTVKLPAPSMPVPSAVTPSSSRAGIVQLHCQLCDVACTGADTYAAHIRGTKHQKVLKLHSTLGKSASLTSTEKSSSSLSLDDKKDVDASADDLDGLLGVDSDVQPVGQEYIEESRNESGVTVGFYCKLCDCKFTDPNAKLMHMKGRRHRLQYKKKVDPNLPVDVRLPFGRRGKDELDRQQQHDDARRRFIEDKWSMECEQLRYEDVPMAWPRFPPLPPPGLHPHLPPLHHLRGPFPPPPGFMPPPPGMFGPPLPPPRRPDSYNDHHVMMKHTAIYPNEHELQSVQETVTAVEKALKLVSDSFVDSGAQTIDDRSAGDSADRPLNVDDPSSDGRVLRSVLRVGPLAKGLLLHNDLNVQLVVLCAEKPTRTLLDTVADRLTKQLQLSPNEYEVRLCVEEAGLIVSRLADPTTTCNITLTSPVVRSPLFVAVPEPTTTATTTSSTTSSISSSSCAPSAAVATVGKSVPDPPDVLDRQKCLDALAELRRTKWFQARVGGVQSCLVILRILRDLRRRDETWRTMSDWVLELLVEKCLIGAGEQNSLSPGDALRRVVECIASGIFLAGPGLCDPCEKETIDITDSLTNQQKEDITFCAQDALRQIAFRRIHCLLGVDSSLSNTHTQTRKRYFSENNDEDASKREKQH